MHLCTGLSRYYIVYLLLFVKQGCVKIKQDELLQKLTTRRSSVTRMPMTKACQCVTRPTGVFIASADSVLTVIESDDDSTESTCDHAASLLEIIGRYEWLRVAQTQVHCIQW